MVARRVGIAIGGALAVAGGAIAACSSSNESLGGYSDAGTSYDARFDSAEPEDSSADADAGTDADAEASAPPAVTFVNASPSVGDVRLCWAGTGMSLGSQIPFPSGAPMPASNYPGIPAGGAAMLSDATEIAGATVTLYALRAKLVAFAQATATSMAPLSCADLACDHGSFCLQSGNYFPITPAIVVPTAGPTLVALEGCLASALDSNANAARCGATWDATAGNLHADVIPITPAAAFGPTGLAVQTAQLSPGIESLVNDAGPAVLSFGTSSAVSAEIASLGAEGDLEPPLSTAMVDIGSDSSGFGELGFRIDVGGMVAEGAGHAWMSLAQSQSLVSPQVSPSTYFGDRTATYVVAIVGDPDAPHAFDPSADGGGYDGTGLHVLVFSAQVPP